MARNKKRVPLTLQDLLAYMRTLRRRGGDNYILGRLAPGERAESLVEFLLEKGYRTTTLERVDTIVVSDLHLGSKHSRAEALVAVLKRFEFNRLVLNGDIFDDLSFTVAQKLSPGHQRLLNMLYDLSKTREVVWIRGNHDEELSIYLSDANIPVHEEYQWEYNGKQYLAIHGDQFDTVRRTNPVFYEVGAHFYTYIQRLGPWTRGLCNFLKRKTKLYTRAISASVEGAFNHGKQRNADVILCGHTHEVRREIRGAKGYFNAGGWFEDPCHLITIGEEGVHIHAFNPQGEPLGIAFAS